VYEQHQEELQCETHIESLCNLDRMQVEEKDQFNTFLHYFFHLIRDPKDVSKLTQMLTY
jgi:hypothetical protein